MIAALLHGMVLAFGLILPLGAQNVFVFNQGASQPNLKRVVPVILTASLCDTVLISLAVVGVSVFVLTVPVFQIVLFSVGLLFLLYMGWSIWNSKPVSFDKQAKPMPAKKQILFALSVSLLNPHAILDTIGVIGTSSLNYSGNEKVIFAAACIIISWLWFIGLAIAGKVVGHLDSNGKFIRVINKVSALLIWGVALFIAFQLYEILQ